MRKFDDQEIFILSVSCQSWAFCNEMPSHFPCHPILHTGRIRRILSEVLVVLKMVMASYKLNHLSISALFSFNRDLHRARRTNCICQQVFMTIQCFSHESRVISCSSCFPWHQPSGTLQCHLEMVPNIAILSASSFILSQHVRRTTGLCSRLSLIHI